MEEDKRMKGAQYAGAIILTFCMAFGMYAAGYRHGEEKLWGDVWQEVKKEVKYKYKSWDPCETPPWKKEE